MNIVGIIPARGGSKGIPRKNIRIVAGKPLIAHSIGIGKQAVTSGLLTTCIVSTDDEEIAELAKKVGARVPFLRPKGLAADDSKTIDVLLHALVELENQGESFDAVLLLQPTCPLRTLEEIAQIVSLAKSTGAESVISVYREHYICDLVSYHEKNGFGEALHPEHNLGKRRQENRPLYIRNGTYYLAATRLLRERHHIISERPALFIMKKKRSINIDTLDDLEMFEWASAK